MRLVSSQMPISTVKDACPAVGAIEQGLELLGIAVSRANEICAAVRPLAVRFAIVGPWEIESAVAHSCAGTEFVISGRLQAIDD